MSSIDAGSWASSAISWYQSNCGGSAVTCPSIEVLNEPGGTWFWGSSAMSQSNANAYDSLLQTVYNAFHGKYGAGAPKILGSYDGGYSSDIQWGQELYAGNAERRQLRRRLDDAPVRQLRQHGEQWPSEPRAAGTRQHRQADLHHRGGLADQRRRLPCTPPRSQQADSIYNFVNWARSTGYVPAVYYFNYRDYGAAGDNTWWGVERWGEGSNDSSKKPGWYALVEAANNQPCNVC